MKSLMKLLIFSVFIGSLLLSNSSFAKIPSPINAPPRAASSEQIDFMVQHNEKIKTSHLEVFFNLFERVSETLYKFDILDAKVKRPVADYEKMKYVVFNSEDRFRSYNVKKAIINNLPPDVEVIILTHHGSSDSVKNAFSDTNTSRFTVLEVSDATATFWARDALPVPVYFKNETEKPLVAIDALYYHGFNNDKTIADRVNAAITSHSNYYEGGNFTSDSKGNCLTVNNKATAKIADEMWTKYYGCKTLTRLEHKTGIGHVDEVVRILNDQTALITLEDYRAPLEKLGFKVTLLPKTEARYETYANSLIVNGTVFLPIYGEINDETAIQVYKDHGFNVIPLKTVTLSTIGMGSIHCITMAYPENSNPIDFLSH